MIYLLHFECFNSMAVWHTETETEADKDTQL